ncbi:MAG: OmpP1/FadL family transporter [Armatimonadota bacterium]
MKSLITKAALAVVMAAAISSPSWSTDGYFTNGFGVKSKAMAGATSALSQDALAAATNPAGMVTVGTRFDIGLNLFSPIRDYTVSGNPSGAPGTFPLAPGNVDSAAKLFYMPDMGYNKMLDDNTSLGITIYGNGGMNTTWPASAGGAGTYWAGATGVNLEQMFIAGTYARRVSPKLDFGISLIYVMQNFEADGLASFGSMVSDGNPDNLTNKGKDTTDGVGVRLGVQANVSEKLTLSAAYQPKIGMGKFTRYSDLFAQQGGFDIPANGTIGCAYHTNEDTVVTFDIKRYGTAMSPPLEIPSLT